MGPSNSAQSILEWDVSYVGSLISLPTEGRLLVPVQSRCYNVTSVQEPCTYTPTGWMEAIDGFSTTIVLNDIKVSIQTTNHNFKVAIIVDITN